MNFSFLLLLQFSLLLYDRQCSPHGVLVRVTYVGYLEDTEHDVGGAVYVLDENTLVIDDFSYDGVGLPVAVFVAKEGRNLRGYEKNRIKVPYPRGARARPLDKYEGDGQLVIDTSQLGIKVDEIKWLSIWCEDYQMSFGHLEF